jgi:putative copper export protein
VTGSTLLDLATGWTLFGGLLLSIGAVAHRWAILPRVPDLDSDARREAERALARFAVVGVGLLAAGLLLYLFRQFLEFRDPFAPAMDEIALLLTTPWGAVWNGAMLGFVIAAVCFGLAVRGNAVVWVVGSAAVLGLGFFPGLTGHAAGAGEGRTVALLADAIHVWAAGAWIGGLAVVVALDARSRSRSDAITLSATIPVFSPVALVSAGLLGVTGAMRAWRELESFAALGSTSYGRMLLLKIALVGVVLILGAVNWRRLTPRLGTEDGVRALRRSARLELLAANAVLLATALLVRTSPGGH